MTVYVIIHTTVDDTETHQRSGERSHKGREDGLNTTVPKATVNRRCAVFQSLEIAWSFTSFPASRPSRPGSNVVCRA
jgi:hypothetical protein